MPHEDHEMNWVNAIKGKDQISSRSSYAAHLTEIMLLGIASLRANSQAALRRRQHARHEQRRRQRVPDARVSGGVLAVIPLVEVRGFAGRVPPGAPRRSPYFTISTSSMS